MVTEYGSGGSYTVEMDGPFAGGGGGNSGVRMSTLSASAVSWKGGESPYSQVVSVIGISTNSKIDIQLSADQLELFHDQDIAFTILNDSGKVTLYAVGDKPKADCVFQITLTEIDAGGIRIWGNTVSTNMPRSDFNQDDPSMADFIFNKPNESIQSAIDTANKALPKTGGRMTGDINMDGHTVTNIPNPTTDGDAVNRKFLLDTVKNIASNTVSITLSTSGWSSTAPYTQSVQVDGLADDKQAKAYPNWPENATSEAALRKETVKISSCRRTGSTMTFRCLEDKPTLDIPITVEVSV